MERALLSKEQDAQRFLRELKKERYYEKLGDTEMLKRQKELEERVKHAMEVGYRGLCGRSLLLNTESHIQQCEYPGSISLRLVQMYQQK